MPDKIAYEPHPVSRERKAELRAQGFRILDIVFKPADGEPDPVSVIPAPKAKRGAKPAPVTGDDA